MTKQTKTGKPAAAKETERGYLAVKRVWRTGDRARVRYPMRLRAERMPDNPRRVAIFYGPVLLAADLGPAEDPKAQDPLYVPVLITRGRPAAQWAKPLDAKKLQFRTSGVGRPRDVELKPFFAFRDRRYTVYFDIVSPAEWRQRLQAAEAEREKARRLAERGIDQVKIGDAESEKAHQLQGEKTGAGRAMGRPWRHAVDGGWFAYRLGVDPEKPVDLMCLYWGSESGERLFDILAQQKEDLLALKEELSLSNVTMLDAQPRESIPAYLSAADVALVPLRRLDLFKGALPSKIFDAWVCGCPVLLSIEGEARRVLEQAQAGLFVEPESPQVLAEAVRRLAADRGQCRVYGANGRRFVEAHYSRQAQARRLTELLCKIIAAD